MIRLSSIPAKATHACGTPMEGAGQPRRIGCRREGLGRHILNARSSSDSRTYEDALGGGGETVTTTVQTAALFRDSDPDSSIANRMIEQISMTSSSVTPLPVGREITRDARRSVCGSSRAVCG